MTGAQRGVTLAGVILSGLLSLVALGDKLRSWFRADLHADAFYADFALPPHIEAALAEGTIRALVDSSRAVEPRLRSDGFTGLGLDELVLRYQTRFADVLGFGRITGVWSFQVRNRGSQRLVSIALAVPSGVRATIVREGEPLKDTVIAGVVRLGELLPSEELSVRVWMRNRPILGDEIRLVHDRGRGDVSIRRLVGPLGQFAERLADPFFAVVFALVALTLLMAFIASSAVERTKAPTSSATPGTPSTDKSAQQNTTASDSGA